MTVLWIAMPQKIANACNNTKALSNIAAVTTKANFKA